LHPSTAQTHDGFIGTNPVRAAREDELGAYRSRRTDQHPQQQGSPIPRQVVVRSQSTYSPRHRY